MDYNDVIMVSDEEGNADDDEEQSKVSEARGDTPPPVNIIQVMNSYAREFIFVLAVAFTAIAALQDGPLKSRKANPPKLFFTEPSLVTDLYQGDFGHLTTLVLQKDVSLVMYYAPWDAKSMYTRNEFESVAKFYHQEVFFAAINCWWPDGECSRKFKIYAYPLLIAYVHNTGGIRYEGPLVYNYIISFLDHVLSPMETLWRTSELYDLQTKHEGILIGNFDFTNSVQPDEYQQYYIASLQALTKDPNRKICFSVVTNPTVASKFNLKSTLQLFLWNGTETYSESSWTPNDILNWAYAKLNQVTQWVTPSGTKSRMLSSMVEKAATLIMFTPRNLLFDTSPYYDLLREVALDYHNCNESSQITSLLHRIVLKRHILQEEFTKLIKKCHLANSGGENICRENPNSCDLTCCQSQNLKVSTKALNCFCRICLHHVVESMSKMKLSECENTLQLIMKGFKSSSLNIHDQCRDVEVSYPTKFGLYNRLSLKCHSELEKDHFDIRPKPDFDVEDSLNDDRIYAMVRKAEKIKCIRLKLALNYSNMDFPKFPASIDGSNWKANFSGLKCRTNRTLLFIVMDSVQFHSFAEKLGIDILNNHHQTAAVIVESKQENMYVLEEHINKKTLVEFIKNYSLGSLDRFLRSTVKKLDGCGAQQGSICVRELTTSTFSDFVMKNDTDVILMYYAAWCGACASVSHIFLAVANFFVNVEKVKFARISGEDHDLPWEYTVEKYPTIILFPAFRKADSVEFPSQLPITTPNLLHFIFANSQPSVRLLISLQMCNKNCVAYNLARSSSETLRLFRDYRVLLNQLNFIKKLARKKPKKTMPSEEYASVTRETSLYMQHLINCIRNKRSKIEQAYQLRSLLQKKRDRYINEGAKPYSDYTPVTKSPSIIEDREKIINPLTISVPNEGSQSYLANSEIVKDEL